MSFTVTFDSGGAEDNPLARFSWTKAVTEWADSTAPEVTAALKAEAPVGQNTPRPGRLRDAIRYERATEVGSATFTWYSNTPYTGYVLGGTGPHLISAKAARALHWTSDGGSYFAKSVQHPGTKANPFNERAITPITDALEAAFQEAVMAAMEGL